MKMKSKVKIAKSSELVCRSKHKWYFYYLGFKILITGTDYTDADINKTQYSVSISDCSAERSEFKQYLDLYVAGYRKEYNHRLHKNVVFPFLNTRWCLDDICLDVKAHIFKWFINGLDPKGPFKNPTKLLYEEDCSNNIVNDGELLIIHDEDFTHQPHCGNCTAWNMRYKTWSFFIVSATVKVVNKLNPTNILKVFCDNEDKYKALPIKLGKIDTTFSTGDNLIIKFYKEEKRQCGLSKRPFVTEVPVCYMEEVVADLVQAVNYFEEHR